LCPESGFAWGGLLFVDSLSRRGGRKARINQIYDEKLQILLSTLLTQYEIWRDFSTLFAEGGLMNYSFF
jgi:hypothetical protein